MVMPNLAQLRRLVFLIEVEAKLLAEQGDYETALERCLSMHKMALHAADRTIIGYLVAISISGRANTTIQSILKDTTKNSQVLNRFKEQFIHINNKFPLLRDYIIYEAEMCAATIQKDKAQAIVEMASDEECFDPNIAARILTADEEFFERNKALYMNYMTDIQAVLDSNIPYMQAYAKFQESEKRLKKEAKEKQAPLALILTPAFDKIYSLTVRRKTHANAIETAIEIYVIKAKIGRLPDTLPAGLPPDLFSDRDFQYEKTKDGFVLRCQGKDLSKDEIHQYEFKVKK
jgi:hypothetical protein